MSAIAEAKEKFPLPSLLHRLGLGEHAKKSARCPFHDDKRNSFSVYKNGSGEFRFKCHAGCGAGDEINFLELHESLSRRAAVKRFLDLAGVNGSSEPFGHALRKAKAAMQQPVSAFDWQKCVDAVTPEHLERLSDWRGLSGELCSWLHKNKLVGLYNGHVAFPVDNGSHVVAVHHCPHGTKDWLQLPKGHDASPLIIGELLPGDIVHIFESQWDAFAFMDASGERSGTENCH